MDYTAEKIDIKKFEDGLEDYRRTQMNEMLIEKSRLNGFFDGYQKAIEDVKGMLHCSYYEKNEKKEQLELFLDGVDSAMLAVCEELEVEKDGIAGGIFSVKEKAELVADRIRDAFEYKGEE